MYVEPSSNSDVTTAESSGQSAENYELGRNAKSYRSSKHDRFPNVEEILDRLTHKSKVVRSF